MRNSTRATPPLSLAFADSVMLVVPAGNDWLLVGAVNDTVGGVLVGGAPQTVPFNVNDAGGLLAPLNVPLKPTVKLWLVPRLRFQSALLATVTCEPDCVTATGQPFCSCWPFGKLNSTVQPFKAGPLLVMTRLAPNPLPPTHVGQV